MQVQILFPRPCGMTSRARVLLRAIHARGVLGRLQVVTETCRAGSIPARPTARMVRAKWSRFRNAAVWPFGNGSSVASTMA